MFVEDVRYGVCESEKIQSSAENANEECKRLCKWCRELLAENERLEDLVELAMDANDRNNGVIRQYQSALMHYNEAIHLKFEQKVADEVAKAGFRQKPGPKKGSIKKHVPKISRRGKTNHSDWNAQEISVESPTSEMAPPWKLKKDDKDNLSTAMQLQIASS